MFVFRLFETVCRCLEVLVYVCALRGRVGVHMCATMIATPHLGKTNTSRDPYISSCREVLQTGVKYIYPPTAFFFLYGITRWSCSAKNPLGAVQRECEPCVWERKPKYVTLESNGWGWESEGRGVLKLRGRKWRGDQGTVGEWPFTRQLFSLRCLFSANLKLLSFFLAFFFSAH